MKPVRWIKISAMLLAAATVVQLCGCAAVNDIKNGASFSQVMDSLSADIFGEEEQEYTEVSVALPRHPGYAAIEDKTAYDSLRTDEEREAYLSMEQSIFRVTEEPGDGEGIYQLCRALIPDLTSVQIFKVKEAVLADHPEAFWLNGDYTLGRNAHDGLYITLYSSMSAGEIPDRARAIAEKVSGILREIKSGLNEYDREMIIHDCLVRDVQYDEEAAVDISGSDPAATVYGTLVNGRAVCTGYARAFKLLLNRVGISSMTVKGISRDEGHMWNLVSVDGSWYHVDVTWNDPTEFSAYGIVSHNYFNLTDADIVSNHDVSPNYIMLTEEAVDDQEENARNLYNFDLPECRAEEGNFYARNAVFIDRLDDEGRTAIAREMRSAVLSGRDTFYLIFPDGMETQIVEDWLNSAMSYAMLAVNIDNTGIASARPISTYKYSSFTEDNWCNAFIFKLLFDEQPAL